MKKFILLLFSSISNAIYAQDILKITYVAVPRENSETFLELHKKFTNLSLGEARTIKQSVVFALAFEGDYTYALYDFYDSEEGLVVDATISKNILEANIKAMNLDTEAQKKMNKEYLNYLEIYTTGHSDQVRTSKGLEELGFLNDTIDWSSKKVVVVDKYNTKSGKNTDFREVWVDSKLKMLKHSRKVVSVYTSRHLYGSGMDWHTYMFYNSWSDFAAYEESNFGFAVTDMDNKFWSAISDHENEILMWIGGICPETKMFIYAK